jgi:hypothetical protein
LYSEAVFAGATLRCVNYGLGARLLLLYRRDENTVAATTRMKAGAQGRKIST